MSEIVKEIRHTDAAVVVVAAGELTLREAPDFHDKLIEICETAPDRLVINLKEITFIDSSGVGILAEIYRRMKRSGGKLALTSLNKMVRSVFEITRLDHLLSIYETEEEALQS